MNVWGAGTDSALVEIGLGPRWRVYLSPDRVPAGVRWSRGREGSRLVADVVGVSRVTVVERGQRAGGVGLSLSWVGEEARARLEALPDPVIYTDGSFRVIDETLAMFEGASSGLGMGALVVINREEWRQHPVTAFRFGDATIGFSSAFDVESVMVSAAADLSGGLVCGRREVYTDCQSVVSRTDRGGFGKQSGRGHTVVMRHIYRARKGGAQAPVGEVTS